MFGPGGSDVLDLDKFDMLARGWIGRSGSQKQDQSPKEGGNLHVDKVLRSLAQSPGVRSERGRQVDSQGSGRVVVHRVLVGQWIAIENVVPQWIAIVNTAVP